MRYKRLAIVVSKDLKYIRCLKKLNSIKLKAKKNDSARK